MDNYSLEKQIADCNKYVFNLNKRLIEEWCREAKVTEPVGFYNNITDCVMEIYSRKCGCLIGYEGEYVNCFIEKLNEAFHTDKYKVKFIDVKGGIVNCN